MAYDTQTVDVYDDGVLRQSFSVNQTTGAWGGTISVPGGSNSIITAKGKDAAGNESSAASKEIYTGSTTTPDDLTLLDDSGSSSSDNITNDNTPRIRVGITLQNEVTAMNASSLAQSTVKSLHLEHSDDGGSTWGSVGSVSNASISFIDGKTWYYDFQLISALGDGDHQFRAYWTDQEDNTSNTGSILTITVDTNAPNTPSVSNPTNAEVFIGTTISVDGTAGS